MYFLSVYDKDDDKWECVNDEFLTLKEVQAEIDMWAQEPCYKISVIEGDTKIVRTTVNHTVVQ